MTFQVEQPTRAEIDAQSGQVVLEFGTDWCGYCRGAKRFVDEALGERPDVRLLQVEDGPGRELGRSYRVKLWPTLIFLQDGVEQARVVRPTATDQIREGLASLPSGG